ncbi:LysR family transcriptional regulator [Gordonia sp. ABSL11-1]|uniref:LysR family transcriptional regulator n=1 Tax=Gordonia sp. ABSL11-1 TaxID=3053924 RepID=UPI0025729D3A|nr:LysR family transcriptional regulator [Gordonia sp. ABSL11-1]MDL9945018.1 LysR family transcriptional regulator [Gordonia sp. ABSL11-1]
MELRHLEYFLACVDQGTFTAAARSLRVVQSAVSTGVAKLEREVGERLFDRTPTVLVLTDAGRAVVGPARAALRSREDVFDAVDGVRGDIRGEVAVGALVNVVSIDLAEAFAEIHRRHPGITIAMRQNPRGTSGNIIGVRSGTLDLAFLGAYPADLPGLSVHRLAREPLVLVCAPDHRLALAGSFTTSDLADERMIDYPPGWGTRAVVDRDIPHRRTVIEVADQFFGMSLAAKGFGVTLVPLGVAHMWPGATIVPCTDKPLMWDIAIAHSSTRTPSRAARAVLDAVLELARPVGVRRTPP